MGNALGCWKTPTRFTVREAYTYSLYWYVRKLKANATILLVGCAPYNVAITNGFNAETLHVLRRLKSRSKGLVYSVQTSLESLTT